MMTMDYEEACQRAADGQGITAICETLSAAGIPNTMEQTGGFCMVAYVWSPAFEQDPSLDLPFIGINSECVVFGESQEADEEILADLCDSRLWDGEGNLNEAGLALMLKVVKENLGRIGR